MNERRLQLLVSAALLVVTVWYAVTMASYASNAGRVPLIVALVLAGVLVVQMIAQIRGLRAPEPEPDAHPVLATLGPLAPVDDDDPMARAEQRVHEVEEATVGYGALLALDQVRRNRFIAIALFSVLFYVGALMIGFVLTTGVLITAFLLFARERAFTAVVAGAVSAGAVWALVVVVLGLPALDGYLF